MNRNQPVKSKSVAFQRKNLWRRLVTPRRVFALALLTLPILGVFGYYYVKFSTLIDQKLRGEAFVRASGIYAAPARVSPNSAFGKSEIAAYLTRIGYVPKDKATDAKRGKYALSGNTLEVTPSSDAAGAPERFPHVRIRFAGERPTEILDLDSKQTLSECLLEPELLTSLNKDKEKRKIVEFKDLPKDLVNAITSIEDRRYFAHAGLDFRGLARAIYHNFTDPEGTQQGASTITQQLVKNFFLTPERTLKRKLAEAYIAVLLETRLTKEEIFQMYCNEIYLGQDGSYSINGVGEAASFYFGKDVINLTLPEAAFIAGIIRGPGYYSPYQHLDRATERRNKTLGDMLEEKRITQAQHDAAIKTKVEVKSKRVSSNADAPYFLDYLQQQLTERNMGKALSDQSLRVYTTIDMQLQQAADKAFRDGLAQLEKGSSRIKPGSLQGALVALNAKTGEVVAMVGGRDYGQSQLNRAIEARRQPGSVFKPIVYTAAVNTISGEGNGFTLTPASRFLDAKRGFLYANGREYSPDNFGEGYSNQKVTLRTALTKSLNVVTVEVAEKVGYAQVARMAERFGLPRPDAYPALALGVKEATPLEVARAYTAFPNRGKRCEPMAFTTVTDSKGKSVYSASPQTVTTVSSDVACVMTHLLQGPIARGTAVKAQAVGAKALAGKTGTSRDGWFAGFTPNLVCVVYVGYDDNSQLGITGGNSALPIWTSFMKRALALRPDLGGDAFPDDPNVEKVQVDLQSGLLPSDACSGETIEEFFIKGTAPTRTCGSPDEDEEDAGTGTPPPPDPEVPIPPETDPAAPPRAPEDDDEPRDPPRPIA
jgi:penicillin-binding protein 1B